MRSETSLSLEVIHLGDEERMRSFPWLASGMRPEEIKFYTNRPSRSIDNRLDQDYVENDRQTKAYLYFYFFCG